MKFQSSSHTPLFLGRFVNDASLIVAGIGLIVIVGWFLNIPSLKSFLPGLQAMRFNTALCLLLLGSALWLLYNENASPDKKNTGKILASLALLISLLTMGEYLFQRNLGIDELIVRDLESPPDLFPGRMSPIATLSASFASVALLILGSRVSRILSSVAGILSLAVLLNYLFDYHLALGVAGHFYTAGHTSAAFLILSLATIASRPSHELVETLTSNSSGSKVTRLLLPGIIFLTILIGWLVEWAESRRLLDVRQEAIFLVLLLIVLYSPFIYYIGRSINRAEEAFRASERRYRGLVENFPNGSVTIFNRDLRLVFAEGLELKSLRLSPQEFIGRHFKEITPPETWETARSYLQAALEDGRVSSFETSFWDDKYYIFSVAPLREANGTINEIHVVTQNITERKNAEMALQESEARLKNSQEIAHIGHWSWEPKNNRITVSDELYRIFGVDPGYTANDLNEVIMNNVHPEDRQRVWDASILAMTENNSEPMEFRALLPDGSVRNLLAIPGDKITDDASSLIKLSGIIQDVTERKKAEEKERRNRVIVERLQSVTQQALSAESLYEMLPALCAATAEAVGAFKTSIMLINSSGFCHRWIGHNYASPLEPHQVRSNGVSMTVLRSNQARFLPDLYRMQNTINRQMIEEGLRASACLPLRGRGETLGVFWINYQSTQVFDEDEQAILGTFAAQAGLIIEQLNQFENLQKSNVELEVRVAKRTEELSRMNVELEHASRTKDEFLANMSHELRSPLNSILGLSELLLEQKRDALTAHQQKSLSIIESSGRHLLELINDILDISKIEAGKLDYYPELVGVEEICQASLNVVKSQAIKKSISLFYEVEKAPSKFLADPRRLKQILVNLLTNAVKFTPAHGKVALQVRANAETEVIQFSILDTGIGIAPEDLRRLFQPFTQVDSKLNRQYEGTGLGLMLVQKLTDLHGGSVHVESKAGEGSTFTVNLPWMKDGAAYQETREAIVMSPTSRLSEESVAITEPQVERGTILLAEDNLANILTLTEYLESHDYQVFVAHDGMQAIEKARETSPDIILMDIQMPAMDGLEATQKLRLDPSFTSTPIIALTALAMPGDRERCLAAGANEYLSKPVSLRNLLKTIGELTAQQTE